MEINLSITWVYILAAVLPILIVPMLLPKIALMARRKNITDKPNERKLQKTPVMVTGGTVLITVICIVMLVLNVFYQLDLLFSALCVMIILYSMGLLDDTIGLTYQFKFVGQIVCVLLLFLCGGYQIVIPFQSGMLSFWASLACSLFLGLLLINAFNFIDGIDGLASGIGILLGLVMAWWDVRHGMISDAVLSLTMSGALFGFFFFNVFSSKYKMYLGDSGSLMLGAAAYLPLCVTSTGFYNEPVGLDAYDISFFIAAFSVIVLDLVRVVLLRLSLGRSPFLADRNHLHHILVDVGFTHHAATLFIVSLNVMVLIVWFVTAKMCINLWVQGAIVVIVAVFLIWTPFFVLAFTRRRNPDRFARLRLRVDKMMKLDKLQHVFIQRIIDYRGLSGIKKS